jgi:hypothetical protein
LNEYEQDPTVSVLQFGPETHDGVGLWMESPTLLQGSEIPLVPKLKENVRSCVEVVLDLVQVM